VHRSFFAIFQRSAKNTSNVDLAQKFISREMRNNATCSVYNIIIMYKPIFMRVGPQKPKTLLISIQPQKSSKSYQTFLQIILRKPHLIKQNLF